MFFSEHNDYGVQINFATHMAESMYVFLFYCTSILLTMIIQNQAWLYKLVFKYNRHISVRITHAWRVSDKCF